MPHPTSTLPQAHPLMGALMLALSGALLCACTTDNSEVSDPPEEDQGPPTGGEAGGGASGGNGSGGTLDAGSDGAGGVDGGASGGTGGEAMADLGLTGGAVVPDAGENGCTPACASVADCAAELCGDGAAAARETILGDCAAACAANPSFEIVVGGIDTCADTVDFARQNLGEAFGAICDETEQPMEMFPVCDVFAERISTCVGEACEPAAEVSEDLADAYRYYCNGAANRGEFDPDQLGQMLSAMTPCENPIIADIVTEQTGPEGDLEPFCRNGAFNEAATCAAACAVVGPCIEPDSEGAALRDPGSCEYICAVSTDVAPVIWTCLAEEQGETCDVALACFGEMGPAPEAEICVTYSARVASCTEILCPAVEAYSTGLATAVRLYCNQVVAGDEAAQAVVAAVTADTPCDDTAIGPLVNGQVVDDPEVENDGSLAPFCTAMEGTRTPEICQQACASLGPCVPPESPGAALRDPDYCAYFCGTDQNGINAEQWACSLEAAGDCGAIGLCFAEE